MPLKESPKSTHSSQVPKESRKLLLGMLGGFLVLLAVSFAFSWLTGLLDRGLTWDERAEAMRSVQSEIKQQVAKVKASAGNDCSYDGECRLIGLGTPSCEHHKNYLVYSVSSSDSEALAQAVIKMNDAFRRLNILSMEAPTCGTAPKKPRCLKGKCAIPDI